MNTTRLLIDGEAARLLRMPLKRLKIMALAGGVPHVMLPDGDLRFDSDDLRRWVGEHKVPVDSPEADDA